jgi:two-component system response regulator RegX3
VSRLLVVDDELNYVEPLSFLLDREGFSVDVATSGSAALEMFEAGTYDIVLLDLMLPGVPGTDVCRQLRKRSDVPIIMLTAKGTELDKVLGLELGADDYVTKPFSARELVARIRAVMRRARPAPEGVLRVGPIVMDVERYAVTVNDRPVRLTPKEFELLEVLLRAAGRVLTRDQLMDLVWGSNYVGDTKTLDVHIKRLRAKLEPDPSDPRHVLTVRGVGYRLVP